MVAPVVAVGVDGVAGDESVGRFADDGDGGCGGQDEYRGAGVRLAGAEVVDAAAVARGEFAELVDGVVADSEVSGGVVGGVGFGAVVVGLRWCGARW